MGGLTLYGWFAATADRHPAEPALEVGALRLTYRHLRDAVDALAGHVAAAGGDLPSRVGILATRTPTAYVGYLAALRLGATVVPMNPAFPVARNAAIAEAARVTTVIADAAGAPQLTDVTAATGAVPLAYAGDAWRVDATAPGATREPGPDDVAYTLFTSGSTGTPKGVPITHANIDAFLAHHAHAYDFGPGARWLQNAELTFDSSVEDMFLAWSSGGCLVVPTRDELLGLVRFVADERITHCVLPPSAISFARRLRSLRPGCMPGLRCTFFGAEQLTLAAARAWRDAAPNCRIDNIYGPTEVTISCLSYRLPDDPADWPATPNDTVPIGRPYPGVEHLVLDPDGNPADVGELCVRGPQRFGGYLDPAFDAGRFLRVDGGRGDWYRTGDRVTRHGGELVHLGRLDHQVKIRGHRVELGEIESVLRRHPRLDQVVVVAVTAPDGETDLLAGYTGDEVDTGELVELVHASLPGYMLPRRFTYVPEMPRTDSGKVDRLRLAADLTGAAIP